MDNNEQLNQDSPKMEGIENENIAQNNVKQAISADDKNTIINLIQPNTLPG